MSWRVATTNANGPAPPAFVIHNHKWLYRLQRAKGPAIDSSITTTKSTNDLAAAAATQVQESSRGRVIMSAAVDDAKEALFQKFSDRSKFLRTHRQFSRNARAPSLPRAVRRAGCARRGCARPSLSPPSLSRQPK